MLPRHRAVHVTPTVTKAAAGAVEHLPIAVVGGLPAALERLKEAGLWVVGLDAGGDTPLHDLPFAAEPVVLVLGAEGRACRGWSASAATSSPPSRCGAGWRSLNVAAAGGHRHLRGRPAPDCHDARIRPVAWGSERFGN